MTEETRLCLDDAREGMENAINHLDRTFHKIRAGKASPEMLESVSVDYYGTPTPISQVANINTPDPKQITVQPWEKAMLAPIEKAILNANLGFNPQNNGELIRISIPALTEERRRELVKQCKQEAENAKVSIRSIRKTANDMAKELKEDGTPEDAVKKLESDIQDLTNKFGKKTDELLAIKEAEIMTV